ncbi:hypothetical protein ACTXT7_010126 [Hymenolepis weldensis]
MNFLDGSRFLQFLHLVCVDDCFTKNCTHYTWQDKREVSKHTKNYEQLFVFIFCLGDERGKEEGLGKGIPRKEEGVSSEGGRSGMHKSGEVS